MPNHVRNPFLCVSFFWVDIRIYIYAHDVIYCDQYQVLVLCLFPIPPLRCFDRPKPWCFPQKRPGVFASERDAKDKLQGDVCVFIWKLIDLEKHLFLRKLKQKFLGQGSLAYSILKSTWLLPSLHIGLY